MKKKTKKQKKVKRKKARKWPSYSLAGVRFSDKIYDERKISSTNKNSCDSGKNSKLIVSSEISHWWTGE